MMVIKAALRTPVGRHRITDAITNYRDESCDGVLNDGGLHA